MPTSSFSRNKKYIKTNAIYVRNQRLVPFDSFSPSATFKFTNEGIYDQAVFDGSKWVNAKLNSDNFSLQDPEPSVNCWFYVDSPNITYSAGDTFTARLYLGGKGAVKQVAGFTAVLNFNKELLTYVNTVGHFPGIVGNYDSDELLTISVDSFAGPSSGINIHMATMNFTVNANSIKFGLFIRNCVITDYTAIPPVGISPEDFISIVRPLVQSNPVAILKPDNIYTNQHRILN